MPHDQDETEGSDALGAIAEDSIRIFRLNIFVVGVYTSVVALTVQSGQKILKVFNSQYTYIGMLLWFGTTSLSIYTYRSARGHSLKATGHQISLIVDHEPDNILLFGVVSAVGTLLSVYGLLFGYLDGLTQANLPIWVPIVLITGGLFYVLTIFGWLVGGLTIFAFVYRKANQAKDTAEEHVTKAGDRVKEISFDDLREKTSEEDSE